MRGVEASTLDGELICVRLLRRVYKGLRQLPLPIPQIVSGGVYRGWLPKLSHCLLYQILAKQVPIGYWLTAILSALFELMLKNSLQLE